MYRILILLLASLAGLCAAREPTQIPLGRGNGTWRGPSKRTVAEHFRLLEDAHTAPQFFGDVVDPHAAWTIEGSCEFCRTYRSVQEFREQVMVPFGRAFSLGNHSIRVDQVLLDGAVASVALREENACRTHGGDILRFDQNFAYVATYGPDGKITAVRAWFDTLLVQKAYEQCM